MLWADFFELITPEVKGAPMVVIEAQLRRTAIDFCQEAKLWVAPLDDVVAEAGEGTYPLASPELGAVVCGVSYLWYDGVMIEYTPLAQMLRYTDHWPTATGDVETYTQLAEDTVTLYRVPSTAGKLIRVHGVLRPSRTSTGLPDWIGDKHFDVLVAGAKARLMAMAGMEWSNPQGALLYAGVYKGDTLAEAQRVATVRSQGPISMQGGVA